MARPSPFLVAVLIAGTCVATMATTFVAKSNIGPAFATMNALQQTAQTQSAR